MEVPQQKVHTVSSGTASPTSLGPSTPQAASSYSSLRHPLTRPLSPDLPRRDALYLFANFSSYMRSPEAGREEMIASEDFRDTVCLLEHARTLASSGSNNVHVLHLKYRFPGVSGSFRSPYPYPSGDMVLYSAKARNERNPVPQPFSALHDPVLKIDYGEHGVFDPLPSQVILAHIAKVCQPPPRIIVVSYVASRVSQNHLASLSTLALASSPPIFVFSPLETRLREAQPLHIALHHAIPISMYAWPPGETPRIMSKAPSPSTTRLVRKGSIVASPMVHESEPLQLDFTLDSPTSIRQSVSDPVATLTVVGITPTAHFASSSTTPETVKRIPLWALAPGVGVLHGSMSASIGVKLSDFSAVKIASNQVGETGAARDFKPEAFVRTYPIKHTSMGSSSSVDTPPVEPLARPYTPAHKVPALPDGLSKIQTTRLTTSDRISPAYTPASGLVEYNEPIRSRSWTGLVSRVSGWKRGRKELMEDVLEELGVIRNGSEAELMRSRGC